MEKIINCPICQNKDISILTSLDELYIFLCKKCGMIWFELINDIVTESEKKSIN